MSYLFSFLCETSKGLKIRITTKQELIWFGAVVVVVLLSEIPGIGTLLFVPLMDRPGHQAAACAWITLWKFEDKRIDQSAQSWRS